MRMLTKNLNIVSKINEGNQESNLPLDVYHFQLAFSPEIF